MKLNKIKLGKYIKIYNEKCGISNLSNDDISGVNKEKEFFEPSPQVGADTSKYKIVPPGYFACNLMHVGRDVVLPIAYNHTNSKKIVSPAYQVFKFINNDELLAEYFFLYLKSYEKDRYFWFNTDSSIRDGMSWEDFINVEIELPSLDIQKKYVAIYNDILANQKNYENGLEDLEFTCNIFIEHLKRKIKNEKIGPYITRTDYKNGPNGTKNVMGVSTSKEFRKPTAKVNKEELANYKVVKPRQISFVQTTHNEKVFAYALNNTNKDIVVTSVNEVFSCNEEKLLPEYLSIFFNRKEFDRYARFHSWGTARETFTWNDLINVEIPIADLKIQESISNIYKAYKQRKKINELLKKQLKDICPILIKGSLEESKKEE
ncbi:MAG: restriction endonuclease subunit S [Clostridia bacterium]|nr:restriction endonuclease subunit S [Clostridia bacterium]